MKKLILLAVLAIIAASCQNCYDCTVDYKINYSDTTLVKTFNYDGWVNSYAYVSKYSYAGVENSCLVVTRNGFGANDRYTVESILGSEGNIEIIRFRKERKHHGRFDQTRKSGD